jgi:hypothetical protein
VLFVFVAVLCVLALVLDGAVAGVAALAAMIAFVAACSVWLRRRGGGDDRAGLTGFIGHWF